MRLMRHFDTSPPIGLLEIRVGIYQSAGRQIVLIKISSHENDFESFAFGLGLVRSWINLFGWTIPIKRIFQIDTFLN